MTTVDKLFADGAHDNKDIFKFKLADNGIYQYNKEIMSIE